MGASGSSSFSGSLGHDFIVNSPITVTHLGVFDSGADGLARTLTAEIWGRNSGTTKLAALEFTSSEPGSLLESNRLKPLSESLLLGPGDYAIVAHGYGHGERAGDEGFGGPASAFKLLDDGDGLISFVGTSCLGTSPGSFPGTQVGGTVNKYSAGTFQFTTGGSVSGKIATDIQSEMLDLNTSAYVRVPFTFHSPDNIESMTMTIEYSAGFVAYLNGQEIAHRNAPSPVSWNSVATMDAVGFTIEAIDVSGAAFALKQGDNLLAVHGLNEVMDAPEFLILPELQIDTIEVIMLSAENAALYDTVKAMSNHFVGATVVHNNREVFYDVGVRQVGTLSTGRTIFILHFVLTTGFGAFTIRLPSMVRVMAPFPTSRTRSSSHTC